MFWNRKIKKDMIPKISFSSRATLKKESLLMANGDIKRASEIYDFLVKDMEDIPMNEPIQPTMMTQVKDITTNVFTWAKENKDDIFGLIDYVRGMRKPSAPTPPNNPIPKL